METSAIVNTMHLVKESKESGAEMSKKQLFEVLQPQQPKKVVEWRLCQQF